MGFFISAITNICAEDQNFDSFKSADMAASNGYINIKKANHVEFVTAPSDSKPYYNNIGAIRNINHTDYKGLVTYTGLVTYIGNQVCITHADVFNKNRDNKQEFISNLKKALQDYRVTFLMPSAVEFESQIDDFRVSNNSNLVMFYLKTPVKELIEIKLKFIDCEVDEKDKWYLIQSNISQSIGILGSGLFDEKGFLIGICALDETIPYTDYTIVQTHSLLDTVLPYLDYFAPSFFCRYWRNYRTVNNPMKVNKLFTKYKNWIEGTQKEFHEKYEQSVGVV